MGASPDGCVTDPSEDQHNGLVEIKCPASAEETALIDLCKKSTFCLKCTTTGLELKRQHNYFYQVQGQLHITGRKWCDFVIWTPSSTSDSLFVQRIYYDDSFWKETMYPRLHRFYMGSMLPELASPRHVSHQELREVVPFWNDINLNPT